MRKSCTFLLALLGVAQLSFASVHIIENSVHRFSFEWTTDSISISQSQGNPSQLSFKGANVDLGENKEPVIPAFSFYAGVPPAGNAVMSFSAIASHGVVLSQPPRIRNTPNAGKRYPNLIFSQPWISNGRAVLLSNMTCRQFFLRPFVYDRSTRVLQVLDKGVVTIEFPTAPTRGIAKSQPRTDLKRMVRKLVMNYDVASGWVLPSLAKRSSAKAFPLAATDSAATFLIGDGHSGIKEGTIDENGVIKIPGSDLVRMFGQNVLLSRIALYASYKGELPSTTPAYGDIPDGVSEVPLLRIDNGRPDTLDASDYVLAYVSAISDWSYDTLSQRFTYNLDHFDDYRHYWVAIKNSGPALPFSRMTPLLASVPDTITSSTGHYLLQRSYVHSLSERSGGLEWAWTILTSANSVFSYNNVTLPGAAVAAPCSVSMSTGYSVGSPALSLVYGGSQVCTDCGSMNKYPVPYPGDNQTIAVSIQNRIGDSIELKSIEFRYTQDLAMNGKSSATIFSPEQPGIVRYRVSGLGSDLFYFFRIGNNDQSIMLVDTVRGQPSFEWTDSAGTGIRYFICNQSAIGPAPTLVSVPAKTSTQFAVSDLRTPPGPIDYLVISHPDFMVQAQQLVRHKQNLGRFPNAKAVSINDVYAQFSGGNTDPAAIRNCLAYVHNYQEGRSPTFSLDYVALMGAGHYDSRSLSSANDPSFIPVAEIGDKCVEDFFVYLHPGAQAGLDDSNAVPDMFLGRFPCHSQQEASQMVNKVIQNEDPTVAKTGSWRNRMLLVADDDMQGLQFDPISGTQSHTSSSERVDSVIAMLVPALDIRKVYLFDYPWDAQLEKPEASQALVGAINNGVAIVNYFGHGSDEVWADEHILMQTNISNMTNDGQYPIVNSFSCSVGQLDKTGSKHSLSEDLVVAPKCGAIAAISATREAYAQDNEKLATNFYACVFDTVDSTAARSYGEALAEAKAINLDNNQKVYCYIGDPSAAFLRPNQRISLTIDTGNGLGLDTAKALQQVTITGVVSSLGAHSGGAPFGSSQSSLVNVQVSMFNPSYLATRKDGGTHSTPWYNEPGTPLFMGSTQMTGGRFSQRILIPKSVTLDKPGAKLTAFAWQGQDLKDIALGVKSNIVFHGFKQGAVSDTSGPVISVRPVYTTVTGSDASAAKGASFTDKITAACPFTLEIDVADSSGVDVVSTGPDEGLTYQITGPTTSDRKNINQQFQFVQGDYRRGNATISFDANNQWPLGAYKMMISSQDLLGNVSHRTIDLQIADEQELELYHVFNYPNPMRLGSTCRFYFDLSRATIQVQSDEIRVMIRIYTLSGRLIRVFQNAARGQVFDGRDAFGNLLSPGVYLYQISAADQQKMVKSKIEKLAINPPR